MQLGHMQVGRNRGCLMKHYEALTPKCSHIQKVEPNSGSYTATSRTCPAYQGTLPKQFCLASSEVMTNTVVVRGFGEQNRIAVQYAAPRPKTRVSRAESDRTHRAAPVTACSILQRVLRGLRFCCGTGA